MALVRQLSERYGCTSTARTEAFRGAVTTVSYEASNPRLRMSAQGRLRAVESETSGDSISFRREPQFPRWFSLYKAWRSSGNAASLARANRFSPRGFMKTFHVERLICRRQVSAAVGEVRDDPRGRGACSRCGEPRMQDLRNMGAKVVEHGHHRDRLDSSARWEVRGPVLRCGSPGNHCNRLE